MRTEVPLCRRCCFCVPLRYGLLTWAYLLLVPITLFLIYESLMFRFVYTYFDAEDTISYLTTVLILIFNYALTFLLIVAAHKKNTHLLKLYYTYGIVAAGLNALYTITLFAFDVVNYWHYHHILWHLFLGCIICLIFVGLQLYVIALVRSEIIKLENGCRFEFRNIAAEAECGYYRPDEDPTGQKNLEIDQIDQNSPPTYTQAVTCNEKTQVKAPQNDSPESKEENGQSDTNNIKNKLNDLNSRISALNHKTVSYDKVVNEE